MRWLIMVGGVVLAWLVASWALMLMVGIAHLDWWDKVPAMSYGTAMSISAVSLFAVIVGQVIGAAIEAVR